MLVSEARYDKIVIGFSGASGIIYGIRLLEVLHSINFQTYLIISEWAKKNIVIETTKTLEYVKSLSSVNYDNSKLDASVSSGSFLHDGMVIVPCSMKSLSSIANGYDDTLISRAASVTLKESRKLILVPRETPLSRIHLENMIKVQEAGAIILPAMPGFYHNPSSIDQIVDHLVGKILDQLKIKHELFKRWKDQ
ncbi:MAG: UbiX family flavin prenyltransferase [Nitrososphaeraceae archaeon]|jgi:4-hydroxy-3-polyprenylbenzoate decarboxylase|nr:UbiX family flavin prenyltransferase [Nitrososphaeraceae archaeon]MDW0183731.1 UbiX family flavin prenyltransferase [Nitrososphaeraceae archaeon]MDW0188422.1 UbiX family flavin prenyltransferase [Nitrososphaeraceae archaeon]MDW0200709.1 UbiX family flavin prenyltransferase [Nitrososphaeraceae archaeon]MDW0204655.1 UbiX family flavin prenyltransferase [Nitrososphaeraceae archaeon]